MRRCREGARQRLGSGRSMCGGVGTPLGGDVNVVHDFARHKVPQTGGVLSVPQGLKSFTFGSGIDFSSEPFGYEFARDLPGSQAFSARIRRNPTFSALTGKITHFKKNGCLDRCRGRLGFSAAAASRRAAERSMRDMHRSPGLNCGWPPDPHRSLAAHPRAPPAVACPGSDRAALPPGSHPPVTPPSPSRVRPKSRSFFGCGHAGAASWARPQRASPTHALCTPFYAEVRPRRGKPACNDCTARAVHLGKLVETLRSLL